MTSTPLNPHRLDRIIRRITVIAASLIKLTGAFIAIKAVFHTPPDPVELVVAAFLASGAQVSEEVIVKMLNSFLGRDEAHKPKKDEHE